MNINALKGLRIYLSLITVCQGFWNFVFDILFWKKVKASNEIMGLFLK